MQSLEKQRILKWNNNGYREVKKNYLNSISGDVL